MYDKFWSIDVEIAGPTEDGYRSVHIRESYSAESDGKAFTKAVKGIAEGMGFNNPEALSAIPQPRKQLTKRPRPSSSDD